MLATSRITKKRESEQLRTERICLGIDSGNGFLKAYTDKGHSIKIPSYIYTPSSETESNIVAKEGCSVVYLSGSRYSDLGGKQWLIGSPAYSASPQGKLEIAQLDRGKVDYALQLFLGAIGCMGIDADNLEVNICISIHHAKSFKDDLTKALQGCHTVELGDKFYTITINQVLVVNEGKGVLAALLASGRVTNDHKVLLLDCGYGTTISTVYQFKKQIDRNVMTFGVRELYTAIAKHPDMMKARNGREGDLSIIREGIENQSFQYGKYQPFSFAEVYRSCLRAWANDNLRATLTDLKDQIDSADCMFAVGGGACLPRIDTVLQNVGFQVLNNAHTLNAEGLLALAIHRLGGKS
ncbi:ParM/StbA family protein [Okeania sp. SIO2B3]|uniref:ParM/StbA family protein n=1 Tax=Okeania sp. SIO2B3 TaxID=2607784 RepID=UPI0013C195CD|nr:ParM/StbA family protein [Okeania sp. SIO2B3]NET46501.1 ParM/StbA family protein [Okeania sp. SIO2B3]